MNEWRQMEYIINIDEIYPFRFFYPPENREPLAF